jgi:hypothetical protein
MAESKFNAGTVALLYVAAWGLSFVVVSNLIAPSACQPGKVRYSRDPFKHRAFVIMEEKDGFVKFKDDLGHEGSRETWLFWRDTGSNPRKP